MRLGNSSFILPLGLGIARMGAELAVGTRARILFRPDDKPVGSHPRPDAPRGQLAYLPDVVSSHCRCGWHLRGIPVPRRTPEPTQGMVQVRPCCRLGHSYRIQRRTPGSGRVPAPMPLRRNPGLCIPLFQFDMGSRHPAYHQQRILLPD